MEPWLFPSQNLDMSGLIASGNSTTTLIDRKSWPRWYLTLKLTAQCLRIWHMIDPDEPSDDEEIPERPTAEKARERLVKKARIKSAKAAGAGNPESQNLEYLRLSTESPSSLEPTESQIAEELILMRHHYVIDRRIFNSENLVRQNIKSWIESTVDRELYLTALFKLQNRNKGGVKEIIRVLREMTAPSGTNTESVLAAQYVACLESAKHPGSYRSAVTASARKRRRSEREEKNRMR